MPGAVPGWFGRFQRKAWVLFLCISLMVRVRKRSRQLTLIMDEPL